MTSNYVKLNGWTIAVENADHERSTEQIGESGRTFDGALYSDVRATKRTWGPMRTTQMQQSEAVGLRGILLGRGDMAELVTSEDTGDVSVQADLWTSKDNGAIAGFVASALPSEAADGGEADHHKPWNPDLGAGAGSVQVDPATTNLSVVRNTAGDAANWTAVHATVSADAAHYMIGAAAINVQFTQAIPADYTSNYVTRTLIDTTGVTPGETYTASLYFRFLSNPGTGPHFAARLTQIGGPMGAWVDVTAFTGLSMGQGWQRAVHIVGTAAGGAPADIVIEIHAWGTHQIAFDAIQIEHLDHSTAFRDVATARGNGSLSYPAREMTSCPEGLTMFAWTRGPWTGDALSEWLMGAVDDPADPQAANSVALLNRNAGGNAISAYVFGRDGTGTYCTAAAPWDGDWHWIGLVLLPINDAGTAGEIQLYIDGSLAESKDVAFANMPDMDAFTTLVVGHRASDRQWAGPIFQPEFYPFPHDEQQIGGRMSYGSARSAPPLVRAEGALFEQRRILVRGRYDGSQVGSASCEYGYIPNLEQVEFALVEP